MGFAEKVKINLEEARRLTLEELAYQVVVEGRVFSLEVRSHFKNSIKKRRKVSILYVKEDLEDFLEDGYNVFSDFFPDNATSEIETPYGISYYKITT
ncbi:MAG: hypothetical protein JRI95_15010 [Deltaproteobacteria bacterium]|nr:hypothetical protein [Deltaproteobacteria bacterium]MBW2086673.1 hypothetical protein [Deltaproteobacteria bacterium]